MKKTLAAILALVMLLALFPAVAAAESDYTLIINGGETKTNMARINDDNCLQVELYLDGITDEMMLASTNFALQYDATQLTYCNNSYQLGVRDLYSIDSSGHEGSNYMLLINEKTPGSILIAMATTYGCKIKDGKPFLSFYFRINSGVEEGASITFSINDEASIESISLSSVMGDGKTVKRTLSTDFTPFIYNPASMSGTVEWNASDVSFKGSTAYVLYDGKAHTPRFTVKDENGMVINDQYYSYEYRENTLAGTGYVLVTFQNGYSGACQGSFKIYLPATTSTTVENTDEGIKVTWAPVDGAAGYVIYRRAWSSTTNGWTDFARWNNTTATTYVDGVDANHKVYAGTRYQYGVKAYFARRVDPISGAEIGGNVNEPSGNYNLGEVGPLKTTVRITTRVLNSVSGGSKALSVRWATSSLFSGYEVQVATDSAFTKNVKTVKITKITTAQTTVKSLKAKTTYYVRVRSYHEFEGMTYYGGWSNVKSAKTK